LLKVLGLAATSADAISAVSHGTTIATNMLCRLIDILGMPRALVPLDPGNVSAFGLLTVDVRGDYVRTAVCPHRDLDFDLVETIFTLLPFPISSES
jgi:N-methylhydantoinase A/oxoprolinase/acetone carboxylase beta subunit